MDTSLLKNKTFVGIMLFYVILSLTLTAIGYYIVPKFVTLGETIGGSIGLVIGIVISLFLWQKFGKKMIN